MVAFLLALATLVQCCVGSRLVSEHLGTYRTILADMGFSEETLTVEGLKQMLMLHDDDAFCTERCEEYLTEWIGGKSIGWTPFEKLVDKVYGDQISDDPFQPQEIHISMTDDKSAMKVMWVTGQNLGNPVVEYMSTADGDWKNAESRVAVNFTYTVPQKWWPVFNGVIYEVNMDGLVPGNPYQYRVGGYDTANMTDRRSATFTFKAQPESNNPNRHTRIGVLADHGTIMLLGFAVADKMIAVQDKMGLESVMVVGDLCYAGLSSSMPRLNIDKEDEFEHVWDLWGIQNQPISATRPFMVGPGNHERFYNWTSLTNRYKMPSKNSNGNGTFWYAYEYGNSYWISVDSEESLDTGSEQRNWLINTLEYAVANRARVPWVVVTIHKPIYSSDTSAPSYRERLESLLLQYDVDVTFVGHVHCYERVHPSDNYVPTVYPVKGGDNGQEDVYYSLGKGPVHVIQGNTGAMQFEQWVQPQPAYSAVRFANGYIPHNRTHHRESKNPMQHQGMTGEHSVGVDVDPHLGDKKLNYTDTFGFGSVTFVNSTHMYYEMVPVTGSLGYDKFWIVKERSAAMV